MSSFKFGRKVAGRVVGHTGAQVRLRSHGQSFAVTAEDGTSGSGGSYQQNVRFNPVFDRLEQGSVLEDWVPRDASGINMMFRRMYVRDPIVGPVIDIQSSMPWSEHDIGGIEDTSIRKFYEDAFSIWTADAMSQLSREYLVLGRFCASLLYDERKGYWNDYVPHDPDFLEIQPVPFRGWNPIIDVRSSPAMRLFMTSQDERVRRIRSMVPESYLSRYRATGRIPLDQFGTLFLPRSISPYDRVGTSCLTRCVSLWAIEKALMDAMVTAARRKVGSILHVTCGIDDVWEPDDVELDNYAALFTQTDEDPVGAVIATRTGVQAQEVRQGGQIWKLSDEWAFLAEAKMRALGVSEAVLSGESTYSNQEQSKSLMIENLLTFRQHLTTRMFGWMANTLARAHGFVKDDKRANTKGQIRVTRDIRRDTEQHASINPYGTSREARVMAMRRVMADEARTRLKLGGISMHDAMRLPEDVLITPTIHWRKDMKPTQDEAYIALLEKMEEKGLPVPKRIWASAGGYDIDAAIEMMPEDRLLTAQIEKATAEPDAASEEPAGDKEPEQRETAPKSTAPVAPKAPAPKPAPAPPAAPQETAPPAAPESREVAPEKPPIIGPTGTPAKPAAPASVKPRRNPMAAVMAGLPIWVEGRFAGLTRQQAMTVAEKIDRHGVAGDAVEVDRVIATVVREANRSVARYCCARAGAGTRPALDDQDIKRIGQALCGAGLTGARLVNELQWLAVAAAPAHEAQQVTSFVQQSARNNGHIRTADEFAGIPLDSPYTLSGLPVGRGNL